MKHITFIALCITILGIGSGCDKESEPPNGHLKVTVTYPEAVVIPDQRTYFIQAPAEGAEVRLYDKDAICLGYKDAMLNLVKIEGQYETSLYAQRTNEKGETLFKDIPSGEYYLIVYAKQASSYTEKYIEVNGGDTLKLTKVFSPNASFHEDLEPWDYVMPPL